MKKGIAYLAVLAFSMLIFTGCVSSSPVVTAAKNKDFRVMKTELEKGSEVNAADEDGNTALMFAARSADLNTVEYLIKKGADINAESKSKWTPLHYAVRYNSLDVVKYLLNHGAKINAQTLNEGKKAHTPLYLALYREKEHLKDQAAVMELLLEKGADANIESVDGWTPLLVASRNNSLELVKILIKHNADIKAVTSEGWRALHLAARFNAVEVVEYLADHGAELNVQTIYKGKRSYTPLYLALFREKEQLKDQLPIIKYLLKKGADVNIKGVDGWTALLSAAQNNSLEIVKILTKHNADLKAKTTDGWTVLHIAARYNTLDVVNYFIDKGINLNSQTIYKGKSHNTPLLLTLYREKEQLQDQQAIIRTLLEHGANPEIKTYDNKTILHYAARNSSLDLIKVLVKNRANINARQPDGWTPLHLAARYNTIGVVKFLVDHGADLNTQTIYNSRANYTPLHLALFRGKPELKDQEAIVKYLIAMDTNLMTRDAFNQTPQQRAGTQRLYKLLKYFQNPSLAKKEVEDERKLEQRNIVNDFVQNKDFEGLKTYTDENPASAYYITDDSLRLMFTGPRGMKVGDIRKLLTQGKSELIVVSLIKRAKVPYKEFTLDEIDTLLEMGLSDKVIAAMIDVTTELLKDEQRKKEQQFLMSEQQRIAKEHGKTKVIYQQGPGVQQKTVGDVIMDKAVDKAVDKGIEMLLEKLF